MAERPTLLSRVLVFPLESITSRDTNASEITDLVILLTLSGR